MNTALAEVFWHNYRLARSRLKPLSQKERAELIEILRAGIFLGPIVALTRALNESPKT